MQQDNPGTQEDEYLDRPMDAISSQNILATVETLTPSERAALLGSFLRFMLELAQQVNEIFVTGHSSPAADDGTTGLMLMQQGLALESKLRDGEGRAGQGTSFPTTQGDRTEADGHQGNGDL